MKLNRRNFLHTAGATLAALLAKLRATQPGRKELDAIDAMDCDPDGKMSMAGMDGEKSSIWQSDDGAETWSVAGTPDREGRITALYTASSDRWFIGYEDGELWETNDAGETWKRQEYELIREYREPDLEIGEPTETLNHRTASGWADDPILDLQQKMAEAARITLEKELGL